MLTITTIPARQLSPAHLAAWAEIVESHPEFDSPYFRPEFTQAVAAVRSDVEIGVLEECGEPVGFFPFQRSRWGCGRPVGGPLSDFHAAIVRPGVEWTLDALLAACRLKSWRFHHLLASQPQFAPWHTGSEGSPYLDLQGGFAAYQQRLRERGSGVFKDVARKRRKLEREVGPVRFEFHTSDPHVLRTLLDWKSQQYRRTGLTDVFRFDWTLRLLENLLEYRGEEFAGVISALYAGDHLVAAHMGLRSGRILHYWFPTYNIEFGRCSPGLVMMGEFARTAEHEGIARIDLGKGSEDFKLNFMTGRTMVAEGLIERRPLSRAVRASCIRLREWLRSSPLAGPVELPLRWTRPLRVWLRFR